MIRELEIRELERKKEKGRIKPFDTFDFAQDRFHRGDKFKVEAERRG